MCVSTQRASTWTWPGCGLSSRWLGELWLRRWRPGAPCPAAISLSILLLSHLRLLLLPTSLSADSPRPPPVLLLSSLSSPTPLPPSTSHDVHAYTHGTRSTLRRDPPTAQHAETRTMQMCRHSRAHPLARPRSNRRAGASISIRPFMLRWLQRCGGDGRDADRGREHRGWDASTAESACLSRASS